MGECKVCGAVIQPDVSACPECGAAVVGTTESFEPVGLLPNAVDDASSVTDSPVLVVRKGPETGERFYLESASLTIGRDPGSDIFLNDMTVSRSHARLEVLDGIVSVVDDGSLNGTYVNGVCVDRAELSGGDVLQIGTFQMVFSGGRARL